MYKTLAAWRSLLVVMIVLYHTPLYALTEVAHMGVSLCFVLSGAMLALRHRSVDCSWAQWMWPRARRLYSIHWLIMALLVIALTPRDAVDSTPTLVANALLVQAWVPVRNVYLSLNKPTWFLSSLLVCYACYPLLIKAITRLSPKRTIALALAILAAHCIVMGAVSQPVRDWLFVMPVMRLGEFAWGIALGVTIPLIEQAVGGTMRRRATVTELVMIAAIALVIIAVRHMPWLDCCEDIAVWWIPTSLLVAVSVILNGREGTVGRFMRSRPMAWLGSISLEIYMLAPLVAYCYCHYLAGLAAHLGYPEFYNIDWPITLPLTLIAATILHHLTNKQYRSRKKEDTQ